MKWLKDNWFKVILAFSALLTALGIFLYGTTYGFYAWRQLKFTDCIVNTHALDFNGARDYTSNPSPQDRSKDESDQFRRELLRCGLIYGDTADLFIKDFLD